MQSKIIVICFYFSRNHTVIFLLQERKNYKTNAAMTGSLDWALLDRRPLNNSCFESPSHTNTLLQGLNELRNNDLLLDVTLLVDGKSFKVC